MEQQEGDDEDEEDSSSDESNDDEDATQHNKIGQPLAHERLQMMYPAR